MPPSPAYNWFCVLYTTANIISHAARLQASRIPLRPTVVTAQKWKQSEERKVETDASNAPPTPNISEEAQRAIQQRPSSKLEQPVTPVSKPPSAIEPVQEWAAKEMPATLAPSSQNNPQVELDISSKPVKLVQAHNIVKQLDELVPSKSSQRRVELEGSQGQVENTIQEFSAPIRNLQSSKVPSSRIGRLFHYGGLAASLGYGAASEMIRRAGNTSDQQQSSVMMTEANIKRLVSKLSQMRGAALKLGQFMSIQDTQVLPAEIDKVFRRVQDSAHYMPDWQMEKVMTTSLGPDWMSYFDTFDRLPFAAASIGQVHTAVLSPSVSPTGRPEPVAVKIQFPNIVNSIDSDLSYIKLLLTAGKLLPKGLFLDKTIQVMKEELADECNYTREASFLTTFGSSSFLGGDKRFKVPWVWKGSSDCVLVMERVNGTSVGDADISGLSQRDRNDIAAWIVELCLKELFEFRAMQTDPNWSNFLWNAHTRQIELVDFGATREYSKEFMDNWLRLLQAAASEDRDACIEWSLKLGYLTGKENQIMLNAHVGSMTLLATPFRSSAPQPFQFGQGSMWSDITAEIRARIPVMLMHRLTPPPRETYSLNRKLSGTFLLASRLGATIDTKAIWDGVVEKYKLSS